ncbi:MAG TPA: response regulator [Noviherbaspirillum sp.]|nr:response regulator [Noviherbaspirillum sp.]
MSGHNPVNILLVDDEHSNLLALQAVLGSLGENLVLANSGEEALKKILQIEFAVILLDVRMPTMSGFETARLIRGHHRTNRTPLLFITAYGDADFPVEQAYSLGAVDYLTKPVIPAVLRAKVAFFVDLHRKTEDLARAERERHAAALKAKDQRIHLILDNIRDYAFVVTDIDGRITEWEGGAETITGWPARDAIGQRTAFLFTPEDQASGQPEAELNTAEETGRSENTRWLVRKGGAPFFAQGVTVALNSPSGRLQGFAKIFRDASAERQAIDALQESEALYRAIAANLPNGAVFLYDTALRFRLAEGSVLQHEGLVPGDLEGKTIWDALGTELAAHHEPHLRAALAGEFTHWEHESRGHFYVSHSVPLKSAAGEVHAVLAVSYDITERKLVEEKLRLLDAISEATRTAVDPRTVMMITTCLLGKHLNATRCAYADFDPDNDRFTVRYDWTAEGASSAAGIYSLDRFGKKVAAGMHAGRTLLLRDIRRELAEDEGASMFAAISVQAAICCPLVKEGRLVAMMTVQQDAPRDWSADDVMLVEEVVERSWAHIERVRATEALREADRRKDEFLATLAHELRNPLAPLQTALDHIRLTADDPGAITRARAMMERQLAHLVHLIDDLLDVARITRGTVDLKKEMVDFKTVAENAVETSLPLIDAGKHKLTVTLPHEPLPLEVDPTRIAQVISNLLNNAARYTHAGGQITMTALREGTELVVSVTDTGIGIPAESLPMIFDMFTQVRQTPNRTQGGLGVGLTLVRRFVELHGGTVNVDSPGPGEGCTFTVRLPLATRAVPESSSPVLLAAARGSRVDKAFRILVADDNADAAESLATTLEIGGHVVRIAGNGQQALRLALEFLPDVIFLDIGMPDMDGYEVARRLRKTPGMERVVLVALTGWGTEEDQLRARDAGFDQHLTKPTRFAAIDELLSALAHSTGQQASAG